jgi:hypothetical protein
MHGALQKNHPACEEIPDETWDLWLEKTFIVPQNTKEEAYYV